MLRPSRIRPFSCNDYDLVFVWSRREFGDVYAAGECEEYHRPYHGGTFGMSFETPEPAAGNILLVRRLIIVRLSTIMSNKFGGGPNKSKFSIKCL